MDLKRPAEVGDMNPTKSLPPDAGRSGVQEIHNRKTRAGPTPYVNLPALRLIAPKQQTPEIFVRVYNSRPHAWGTANSLMARLFTKYPHK